MEKFASTFWVVKVNSISADTPADYELKFGLLDDVYSVVDVEGKLGGAQPHNMGGFDLIYANGVRVQPARPLCCTTKLGNSLALNRVSTPMPETRRAREGPEGQPPAAAVPAVA